MNHADKYATQAKAAALVKPSLSLNGLHECLDVTATDGLPSRLLIRLGPTKTTLSARDALTLAHWLLATFREIPEGAKEPVLAGRHAYHFHTSDGPLGLYARVLATSKGEALQALIEALPESIAVPVGHPNITHLEIATCYDEIYEHDIDEITVAEEATA